MTAATPLAACICEFKTALQARAMLRLHEENADGAWHDLISCHRLLRQMQTQVLGQYAIMARLEEIEICQAELKLLHTVRPDANQLRKMQTGWASLPPSAAVADEIDIGERYRFLDVVCQLEQHGTEALSHWFAESSLATDGSSLDQSLADPKLNWNELLRLGNEWYDRLVRISQISTRSDREAAYEQAHADLQQMASTSERPRLFKLKLTNRKSARIPCAVLVQLCVADLPSRMDAADRQNVHTGFVQIGLALAGYRAEHGDYPQRLDELVPEFLASVPIDLYADHAPLRYRREDGGYMLYSVGPNGQDEEAGSSDTFPDADDIAVLINDAPLVASATEN